MTGLRDLLDWTAVRLRRGLRDTDAAALAARLTAHLTAPAFDPAVKAWQLMRLRALAADAGWRAAP